MKFGKDQEGGRSERSKKIPSESRSGRHYRLLARWLLTIRRQSELPGPEVVSKPLGFSSTPCCSVWLSQPTAHNIGYDSQTLFSCPVGGDGKLCLDSGDLFPLDRVPFIRATIMLKRDLKERRSEEESVEGMSGADEPGVYSEPGQTEQLVAWPNAKGIPENVLENSLIWCLKTSNGAALPVRRTRTVNHRATDGSSWHPIWCRSPLSCFRCYAIPCCSCGERDKCY